MEEKVNEIMTSQADNAIYECIDPLAFGNAQIAVIENVVNLANNVVTSVTEIIKYTQDIKVQIKQLDIQLETFIVQTKSDLERFKSAIPILEHQLNTISARIDRITDSIITNTEANDMNDSTLKKHQLLLDLLASTNDSFNNMLVRILSL